MTSLKLISSTGGARDHTEPTLRMGIRRLRPSVSSARIGVQSSTCASSALASDGVSEELKVAKNAAEAAKRKMAALLSNMDHEFRAPLNAILGLSEILANNADDTSGTLQAARQNEVAGHLNNAAWQLLDIAESVFYLVKFEDKEGELNLSLTSFDELIEDVVARLRPLASCFRVQIHTDLDTGLPKLMIDAPRIRQALRSVIDNAIKFSNRNGIVNVSLSRTATGNAAVVISDTGTGISRDDIAHVFQIFNHRSSSFSRRYIGAGLGLSYAKIFVEQHNGCIALESERNVGTTVTIELPFVSAMPKV